MKPKRHAFFIEPGFTIRQARTAFIDHGAEMAVMSYDEISTRPRVHWRKIYIDVGVVVAARSK